MKIGVLLLVLVCGCAGRATGDKVRSDGGPSDRGPADGAPHDTKSTFNQGWPKRFGSTSDEMGYGVAVDASGNVTVTGYFRGTVDFGGGSLKSAGNQDIYVASYTSTGKHRWSRRFGSTRDDYGYDVTVDAGGNVTVTGFCTGTVDFGGGALTYKGLNVFVASFTSAGQHRWSKRFGDSRAIGYGLAANASGDVTVTGSFKGTVDFGGGVLTATSSDSPFVASFTSTGAHRWSRSCAGRGIGYGVATDASGAAAVTGLIIGAADFGGGTLTAPGSQDIFVASYTSTGQHRWSKIFGSAGPENASSVVVDASGNVTIGGYFWGGVDFGGGALTSTGSSDAVVASYTPTGGHRWSVRLGSTGGANVGGLAVDASGNLTVSGYFAGKVSFGGQSLTGAGPSDIFVAGYTAAGKPRWARSFGGAGVDHGKGVTVDASGGVTATGLFEKTAELGGKNLTSLGGYDIFVLHFTP